MPRMMGIRLLRCAVVVAFLACVPGTLLGQQQSAIVRGLVSDANGQPVAAAMVILFDRLGSQIASTQTESSGRFRLTDVPPGTYSLVAELPPQRSIARLITVQAALPLDVDLTLTARAAESVIVQGGTEAPAVTTRMTIAGEALRQVPSRLPSRGVPQVLATLPGWASEDNGLLHVRGVDDGVLYVEDGVPVYDRMDTLSGIAPDPEGVGSINVLTGYIPPEYGLKSGAVIEVQSSTSPRSGWAASVDAGAGSDAVGSLGALGGGSVADRASLSVSFASERSNRFLDPVHPANLHNEGGVVSGAAHVSVLASNADLLKVNITGGRSSYQVPHGEAQEEAGQDQRQRLLQHSQSASWQRFWSGSVVSHVAMYRRHIDADLRSSAADTPLFATSDRQHDRLGFLGSATYERNRHTAKAGFEIARLRLQEDFRFAVTDPDESEDTDISEGVASFTLSSPFDFTDRVSRNQWAFYLQDRVRVTDRFSMDFGVRYDRTRLLVPASQWSPRIGAAYAFADGATTVRASLNRFFQPPQPEHLLLASSPAARVLSPFAEDQGDETRGADLEPERQTAWEVGVDRWLSGVVRLDAAYWSRHVRNYADPNVFFGTTIIFPNSVAQGIARGVDVRVELPRYHSWSSYLSYTLSKVEQVGPINGGLFLEENILEIEAGTRFTPDHDQRHVGAGGLTYHSSAHGFSAAFAARYGSGTPLEVEPDDLEELSERPGAELADFERGRVRPRMILDASVSQTLHRGGRTDTSLRVGVFNVTNRRYALNFGNPFSGTHFGAPRTFRVDLRVGVR
jgi:outer membrane receptor protein involved in Fe transport